MTKIIKHNKLKNMAWIDNGVLHMDVSTSSRKVISILDIDSLGLIANGVKWTVSSSYDHPYVRQLSKASSVQLHRLILNNPEGKQVDHVNGNTLDNRSSNLRACSNSGNARNSKVQKNNKSGLKGVASKKYKGRTKFYSCIFVDGKQVGLGTFLNPLDAAYAYDIAALKHYGDFARTNKAQGLFDLDFDNLFPANSRHYFLETSLEMQNTYGEEVAA